MKFVLISPPYKLGIRFLVPEGMAIVKTILSKEHEVRQMDLFMQIRNFNKQCSNTKFIDLNIFNTFSLIEDYLLYDYLHKKLRKQLIKIVAQIKINQDEIVAFSIHCDSQLMYALVISKYIKKEYGNIILCGGAYFFINPNYVFENFKWIDIVVSGYINKTCSKIINSLKSKKRSLIINKSSDSNRSILPDYSELNLSNYRYRIKNDYVKILPLQTSQGCPFRCNFCNVYLVNSLKVYSPTSILNNITSLMKLYQVNTFYFTNQMINVSYKNTEKLCHLIIKSNIKIRWTSYAHANNLDEHLIKLMAKSGCYHLLFGFESASQRMQKLINKNIDVNHFKLILPILKKYGIEVSLNLIAGYPGETIDDLHETLTFLDEYSYYINDVAPIRLRILSNSTILKRGLKNVEISKKQELINKFACEYRYYSNQMPLKEQNRRNYLILEKVYTAIIRKEYHLLKLVPFFIFHKLYNENLLFGNTAIYKLFLLLSKTISLNKYFKK